MTITFSQSKIKSWRRCHKQYRYKYDEGLTRRQAPSALARGVTIHEMLDARALGKDWRIPLEEYRQSYTKMFADEAEGYPTPEELESLYLRYCEKYKDDGLDYGGRSEIEVQVEHRGLTFKGIIDKIVKDPQGRTFVCDHKCLDSNHTVATPQGPIRLGDLTLQNQVVSSVGTFVGITEIVHQTLPGVEIELVGNRKVRCTPEHRWPVLAGKRTSSLKMMVLRTDEFVNYPFVYLIPSTPQVDLQPREYPISPYVLGSLLGDGSFTQGIRFTSSNSTQLKEFESELPQNTLTLLKLKGSRAPSYYLRGFKRLIRSLGLSRANSYTKFIPPEYLLGSLEQRLDLLQGLMDTDGSVYKGTSHLFTTISPQLAQGVKELVWSLGGVVMVRRPKAPTYQGGKLGQVPYLVKFTLPPEIPAPYRHPEKLKRLGSTNRQFWTNLKVKSVDSIGDLQVTDISVDSQDHLFSMEGVLTHNTHKVLPDEDARFSDIQTVLYYWALRETGEQVDGVMWDYLRTKPPAVPEKLVKGGLSRRANIDTDYETYLKAITDNGLNPDDYQDMLDKVKGNTFFKRIYLPKPNEQLVQSVVNDFFDTAEEIQNSKSSVRNLTKDCKMCSYFSICGEEVRGLDSSFTRKQLFVVKAPS